MEKSEILFPKIKTYKLPRFDRMAHAYPVWKFSVWTLLGVAIAIPIMSILHWQPIYLLCFIPIFIPLIISFFQVAQYLINEGRYKAWCQSIGKTANHAVIYGGPPGIGKSLSEMHAINAMAKSSWFELQYEYWLLMKKLSKDYIMTEDEQEIYDAYKFYATHDGVPCLATNIAMFSKLYKRYSYKFGPSYLKQERRIPYRLCGMYDEIGTAFHLDLKDDKSNKNKALTICDTVKYCRQMAELRFMGTEQDVNNLYKGIRRSVALNRVYTTLKRIGQPVILCWIYNYLKVHFVGKMSLGSSKKFSGFMKTFKRFLDLQGYTKLWYRDSMVSAEGKTISDLTRKEKGDVIVLTNAPDFLYDTRAYRVGYKLRFKPIEMDVFTSLRLTEPEARAFYRETYSA